MVTRLVQKIQDKHPCFEINTKENVQRYVYLICEKRYWTRKYLLNQEKGDKGPHCAYDILILNGRRKLCEIISRLS